MGFALTPGIRAVARVLYPREAAQPILPVAVRTAVHHWMTEIQAEDELREVDVDPRRTAILSGPPGCGKTTLAHHLAARLGLPLVCVQTDRLMSVYVNGTGENIARLFTEIGPQEKDCVLLLDEFDAMASARTEVRQHADKAANTIVDHLLQRIEGYSGTLIAATNRADTIDPALWRRFGLQLEVPLPGEEERFAILVRYLAPFTLPDEALDLLTDLTAGAAPWLLRQLMEGVKRDLVLAPRLGNPLDIESVFARVVAAARPHKEYATPPLWEGDTARRPLADIPWPPQRAKGRKAA